MKTYLRDTQQNNEHHNQLQTEDLLWEHQQYNKNIKDIRKQQSKQIHNHHSQPYSQSYAWKHKLC